MSGLTTANLTDTVGGNTFTVSGWTGGGTLTDIGTSSDTIAATKSAGYMLTNASLSSTDKMSLSLIGFTTANLAATASAKTFTVTDWTGNGTLSGTLTLTLTGTSGDILTATETSDTTLTNTAGGFTVDRSWLRTMAPDAQWVVRACGWINATDANGMTIQVVYQTNAAAIRPLHEWTSEFERFWRRTLNRVKERAESKTATVRNQQEEL